MNKSEFLERLNELLNVLPEDERERSVDYYSEMIDDRIEDGEDEETAVAGVGSPEDAAEEIIQNIPLSAAVKRRAKNRRISPWTVVFAVMASPIWLPLLIVVFAVVLSVYISIWAVVISFAAAAAGIAAGAAGGAGTAVIMFAANEFKDGLFMFGCALMLAGITVFAFFGVKQLIRWVVRLTGWTARKTKLAIVRKW